MFISFDNEFWKNYINYFENDLNKLLLLNEAIKLSKEMDKSLNIENLNLINKIQKIGLNLLKNGALNNEEFHQFIDFLLDKKENFIIKEEELFNTEKNIQSFNLLEAIQKYKLDNDDKIKEKFFKHILHIKDNIFDKIKKAEINFNSYKEIYSSQDKINVFKEKLRILFFHNQNEIEECMKILKEMKNIKILSKLEKLMQIFSEFFQNERKNEIVKIVNLRIRIQTGMMNEINKADIKKEIDEINNILSEEEFNKMDNYRNSIFFVQLYRLTKKNNNKKDEKDILKETETNFNELKYLFEEECWTLKISEPILNKCFHSIRNENDNILKEELKKLINIFSINDFNELKLEGLLKNINIYNKKEEVCLIAEACLYFIDELQIPKTEFSNKIERAKKELSLMKLNLNKIENLMKILEDNGLNISQTKEEDKNYLNVLKYIYEKKGALKFLSSLKSSDIPSLKELVESSDDTLLTGDDIKDMKQCKTFIDNLLSKTEKEKTDKILIQNLIVEVQKEKDIANKFKNYTNNFIEISNLLSKKLNLLPKPIQQIKQLMKEYSFIISLENNNEKPILSEELIYYEKTLDINIDQLIEYAKLINVKPTEKKELINLCREFLDIIEQKENIKQLLKIIGEKGYNENMKIKIDINNNIPSFIFNDIKYDNYKDCYDFLDQLLLEITSIQNIYYEKNELIRYLNGKQINLFNSCFKKGEYNQLIPFLQYLTNDQINNKIFKDFNYNNELNENKYICLLENIKKFFETFLNSNNLNLENIYNRNLVKDKERFHGLFSYLLKDDIVDKMKDIEEHILYLYKFITGQKPMAQNILFCNEETTLEEINSFMYRAFLCQYPSLFTLAKIENLNKEKKKLIKNLLNTLYIKRIKEIKSCVIFIFSDNNDSLLKYFEKINEHNILSQNDIKKEEGISFEENVEIIYSDYAGVGKSTLIFSRAISQKKRIIHFPLGNTFNRKKIFESLKAIQNEIMDEENIAIHLDLYDTKNIELMKELLFCFLITKVFYLNNDLFYLTNKVKIFVEIPSGFKNYFQKFPLLNMFKNKTKINLENLPPLIVSKEINSNIQIVCNYLKLLKSGKLSETDLIIEGISLSQNDIQSLIMDDFSSNSTFINAESLSPEDCDILIKNTFKNESKTEYPTYYQINSFINILAYQLKKFS